MNQQLAGIYSRIDFSSSVLPYVLRDREDCWEGGAQDGHLDLHTAPELCPETDLFTTAHVYVPVLHPRAITSDEPTGVLVIYPFQSHGIHRTQNPGNRLSKNLLH